MPHNVYENIYDEYLQQGRCGSCGFFSKHSPVMPGLGKFEVSWLERESGEVFLHNPTLEPGAKRLIVTVPHCAKGIVHFTMLMESKADPEKLRELLAENRDCPEWGEYVSTVGPQEMLDGEKVQKLEVERRNFELALHRDSQHTQQEIRKVANRQLVLSVVVILLSVAATFAIARFTPVEFSHSGEPIPVVVEEAPTTPPTPGSSER